MNLSQMYKVSYFKLQNVFVSICKIKLSWNCKIYLYQIVVFGATHYTHSLNLQDLPPHIKDDALKIPRIASYVTDRFYNSIHGSVVPNDGDLHWNHLVDTEPQY